MGPILLKKITEELNDSIRGGVISKVHQPTERLLILKIFIRGAEKLLLISAEACQPRMHLTEKKYPNPDRPLRFCAFLRKHISNFLIEDVRAIEGERIAEIDLKRKDEKVRVIIELTGKSSNVILTDSKHIVMDALKYFEPESPRAVSPGLELMPLTNKSAGKERLIEKSAETWNESADRFYSKDFEKRETTKIENVLRRVVKRVEKRLARKIGNLEDDIKKAEGNIKNSVLAELLLTNFKKIERGMAEIEVEDYTQTPAKRVKIKLDAKLTPNENIDRLYRLAKKGKKTIELTTERLPKVKGEQEYLSSLYFSIEKAALASDLYLVRDELIKAGYIKKEPGKKRNTKSAEKKKAEPIEKITREDGTVILIGKSGLGNDLIIKKYARAGDLWFHAKGVPGAHVLLKSGLNNRHSDEAIMGAAGHAAAESKVSGSTKIEVIMADAKEVKKPKGAKPGMVRVGEYKSLMIKPAREEK